jgi:hypothetical protein
MSSSQPFDTTHGFTVRVPFGTRLSATISGLDAPVDFPAPGAHGRLSLKPPHFILEFWNLASESDALSYRTRAHTALFWLSLDLTLPLLFDREPGTVKWFDDPRSAAENFRAGLGLDIPGPIHGFADGAASTIYPASAKLLFHTPARAIAVGGTAIDIVVASLQRGLTLPEVQPNPRLDTATSLYLAHFGESTMSAKLLTLTMCLEALTTGEAKHSVAVDLLSKWRMELSERQRHFADNSEEHAALSALDRELFFRQDASIGSQIRSVVRDALTRAGAIDTRQLVKLTTAIYNKRSELIHNGTLDPDELRTACSDAQNVVKRVLQAILSSPPTPAQQPNGT